MGESTNSNQHWDENDLERLKEAVILLEDISFTARIADLIGLPIEKVLGGLPGNVQAKIQDLADVSLRKAISIAILGMRQKKENTASNALHKLAVATSGGVGGFFGLSGVAVEIPVSTTIMLRSIADIARSEGEQVSEISTQIACIQVFALGGPSADDDEAEKGYFAARAGLAKMAPQIAKGLSESAASKTVSDALAKVLARISSRYSAILGEKVAAQSIPLVGAVGGASINLLFINHFQDIARGHFTVRALERLYDPKVVRAKYDEIKLDTFGPDDA